MVFDFDADTAVECVGDSLFRARLTDRWNTPAGPNGGYVLATAARALCEAASPSHARPGHRPAERARSRDAPGDRAPDGPSRRREARVRDRPAVWPARVQRVDPVRRRTPARSALARLLPRRDGADGVRDRRGRLLDRRDDGARAVPPGRRLAGHAGANASRHRRISRGGRGALGLRGEPRRAITPAGTARRLTRTPA